VVLAGHDDGSQPGSRSASQRPLAGYLDIEALASIHYGRDVYTVPAGRIRVRISGATGQTFTIDAPRVHLLLTTDIGGPHTAVVMLRPGTYTMGSTVPGHRAQGMVTTLHVLAQPVQWLTAGPADPEAALPDTTKLRAGAADAHDRALARTLRRLSSDAPEVTALSDPEQSGTVAGAAARYPAVEVRAAVYRLTAPITLATLADDPRTTHRSLPSRSELVVTPGRVFLVQRDGTVLSLSAENFAGTDAQPLLTRLAVDLDTAELGRALG
jgi:hypothetical protein